MNIFLFYTFLVGTCVLSFSVPSLAMEEEDNAGTSTTARSLMDLPREMHVEIASYFTKKELATLALVNHEWKDISEDNSLWKDIAIKNGIFLSEEALKLKNIKSEVYNSLGPLITLENGTESTLSVMPTIEIFYGPSNEEIKKWRLNRDSSSKKVNSVKTEKLPQTVLGSHKKLMINLNTVKEYASVPPADAYIGDIDYIIIAKKKGRATNYEIIYEPSIGTAPEKYFKERSSYVITSQGPGGYTID